MRLLVTRRPPHQGLLSLVRPVSFQGPTAYAGEVAAPRALPGKEIGLTEPGRPPHQLLSCVGSPRRNGLGRVAGATLVLGGPSTPAFRRGSLGRVRRAFRLTVVWLPQPRGLEEVVRCRAPGPARWALLPWRPAPHGLRSFEWMGKPRDGAGEPASWPADSGEDARAGATRGVTSDLAPPSHGRALRRPETVGGDAYAFEPCRSRGSGNRRSPSHPCVARRDECLRGRRGAATCRRIFQMMSREPSSSS